MIAQWENVCISLPFRFIARVQLLVVAGYSGDFFLADHTRVLAESLLKQQTIEKRWAKAQ